MKEKIEEFIKSDKVELKLDLLPIDKYNKILSDLGWNRDDVDTNGWQVDFWVSFEKEDVEDFTLDLSGSLFYGDYCLSKVKEDD